MNSKKLLHIVLLQTPPDYTPTMQSFKSSNPTYFMNSCSNLYSKGNIEVAQVFFCKETQFFKHCTNRQLNHTHLDTFIQDPIS